MAPRKVIIDCDPGQDDAVALFLAMASPAELDVLGITTVAGNVPLELTQRNARMMCDIAGRTDLPVYAGCEKPLVRDAITAEYIHGATGIDGIDVFEPETPLQAQHAVDFIVETLRNAETASVTLIPTGPMTNIAAAIQRDPAILDAVERIVSMGGAMREGGNRSPSAEFNVLVDPHAADIVYRCGRPVTAMGLDVTHQVLSTRERVMRIRNVGNAVAVATADMLSFFHRYDTRKYGSEGAPLHDPCTVAWLLRPDLFATKACNLSVETGSALTLGHTAVDFWHVTDRPHNIDWTYEVDAEGFYDLLVEKLAVFGD
ncbi:MAG: nucleoside hydrolase [Gammaproteobacteria bacterium]|nr:nucleoside hydrolase [Gammaproteobacteria bacterium]